MRVGLICSVNDTASSNMAEWMIKEYDFEERSGNTEIDRDREEGRGRGDEEGPGRVAPVRYVADGIDLYMTQEELVRYRDADSLGLDLAIFLSKHQSASGTPALTAHPVGNWGAENRFGGEPRALSVAAPVPMLSALRHLDSAEAGIEKTYEATHHGPLLKTPSMFMESGGNADTIADKAIAQMVGRAAMETALEARSGGIEYGKVAIGIGCGHYPSRFTRLALRKGYAFSHMMPRHALHNPDGSTNLAMLGQAVEMTEGEVEAAVVEWKDIDPGMKAQLLSALEELGLDHESV